MQRVKSSYTCSVLLQCVPYISDCKTNYISQCNAANHYCGGSPDAIKCTTCNDPFYSGGYGRGCLRKWTGICRISTYAVLNSLCILWLFLKRLCLISWSNTKYINARWVNVNVKPYKIPKRFVKLIYMTDIYEGLTV